MKYTLQVRDFLKGLLMAVGTSVLVVVQNSIEAGVLTFNWKIIAMAAIAATVSYLLKNFFTDDTAVAKKVLTEAAVNTEEKVKVASIVTKQRSTIIQ